MSGSGIARRFGAAAIVLLVAYTSVDTQSSAVRAKRGMVVSQEQSASNIGAAVLRDGGTAVDAAVASLSIDRRAENRPRMTSARRLLARGSSLNKGSSGRPRGQRGAHHRAAVTAYDFGKLPESGDDATVVVRHAIRTPAEI